MAGLLFLLQKPRQEQEDAPQRPDCACRGPGAWMENASVFPEPTHLEESVVSFCFRSDECDGMFGVCVCVCVLSLIHI